MNLISKRSMLVLCLFFSTTLLAEGSGMQAFVLGEYRLIGQAPDSDTAYTGRLRLFENARGLRASRQIDGSNIDAEAAIEPLGADAHEVLRIRFTQDAIDYEETCLVASDLDNYARLSCLLYRRDRTSVRPGLEAMFIDLR